METKTIFKKAVVEGGAIKIPLEKAKLFLTEKEIAECAKPFQIKYYQSGFVKSATGAAVTCDFDESSGTLRQVNYKVFGIRTITNPRQIGYQCEGQVSIGGKKYSCFTSNELFQIEETGQLVSVATIFVRNR